MSGDLPANPENPAKKKQKRTKPNRKASKNSFVAHGLVEPLTQEEIKEVLAAEGLPIVPVKAPKPGQERKRATKDEMEYRHRQVHRMMLCGVPVTLMSLVLSEPVSCVYRDIDIIHDKMKTGVFNLDFSLMVAEDLAHFTSVIQYAERIMANPLVSDQNRTNAGNLLLSGIKGRKEYIDSVKNKGGKLPDPIKPKEEGKTDDQADMREFMRQFNEDPDKVIDGESSRVD